MRLVWTKWAKLPLVLALVGASLAPGARMLSAGAETPIDAARAKVATATANVEALNVEIAAAQGRADAATAAFWEQQETVYLLEATIEDLEGAVVELDDRQTALSEEVQRIAIDRYMEPVNFESVIDAHALNAKMRADALASLVTGTSEDAIEELREVSAERATSVTDLQDRLASRDAAAAAAITAGEALTAELADLDERRSELLAELAELESELDRLEAVEAERVAAEVEAARIAEERERAEAAAALAAETLEAAPTPEPTQSAFEPAPRQTIEDVDPDANGSQGEAGPDESVANETETSAEDDRVAEGAESDPVSADVVTDDGADQTVSADVAVDAAPEPEPAPLPTSTPEPLPTATPAPAPEPVPTPEPAAAPTAQSGPIVCPLDGPFSHIDDYGAPRPGGRSHQGNDLMAATGTPVLAVVAGQLEHKFGNVGGYTARIKADDGGWYYFAHLSAYENQGAGWVAAGTVIGYVGNTGDAIHTPPHLHFEMHPSGYGSPINPYSAVVASC